MSADKYSITIAVALVTPSGVGDVITIIVCGEETYDDTKKMRGTTINVFKKLIHTRWSLLDSQVYIFKGVGITVDWLYSETLLSDHLINKATLL